MSDVKIRRALIAVYDKSGIVEFAKAIVEEFGIEIISTGGTAKHLKEAGIPVTLVEEVTGFPEMLDGRVKTLHPKIHAAILADRDNPEHMRQLAEHGIEPIDMVVVNLYPFEKTVADPNCTFEQAIEMIDIGGPCLLRAAAKNHKHVVVLSDPLEYEMILRSLRKNPNVSAQHMSWHPFVLPKCVFEETSRYDARVGSWFARRDPDSLVDGAPLFFSGERPLLRYGENPHQSGGIRLYFEREDEFALRGLDDLSKDTLSYNNLVDANAAFELCSELARASRERLLLLWSGRDCGEGGDPEGSTKLCFGWQQEANANRSPTIRKEVFRYRKLPHWQLPGAYYWVTFASAIGDLTEDERDIVMSAIRYWDGKKIDLFAAVVMRDHVHMLLAPSEVPGRPGEFFDLSGLLQSIKAFSGRRISQGRGGVGQVWTKESFDRWIRSEKDFFEKWTYIAENPVKEQLAPSPQEYKWWYGVDVFGSGIGAATIQRERGSGETGPSKAELCSTLDTLPQSPSAESIDPKPGPARSNKAELCATRACVLVKHTNACGVGVATDAIEAYRRAYLGDPNAAMGGILAVDFEVRPGFATAVMESLQRWGKEAGAGAFFVEVWLAPSFDEQAVEIIRTKKEWGKRVRLLRVGDMTQPPDPNALQYRSIAGGMLVQTPDLIGLNEDQWKVVTQRQPTEAEMNDLRLAWLICKHTKSNAITICKDGMLIGNGAGQMSRVMSCRIATWLAKENGHAEALKGAAASSDAFFPFRDGPDILIEAGVTAIIQPGGSKRDEDTIAACNERGVAMIFTGTRHFKH